MVRDQAGDCFLAVDHRGVAAIEQLLFNPMLLYDCVYHHHKNRAAVRYFKSVVAARKVVDLEWLLSHDEADFFSETTIPGLEELSDDLKNRHLPHRAAVIHPSTVNQTENSDWAQMSRRYFSGDPVDRERVNKWIAEICRSISQSLGVGSSGIFLDLPSSPKYQDLQRLTFVKFAGRDPILLESIFPFTSAVNSYAQQCKYRIYLFAWRSQRVPVAAAAFKVFREKGIVLNQEAFRLAKLDPAEVAKELGEGIPEKRHHVHADRQEIQRPTLGPLVTRAKPLRQM